MTEVSNTLPSADEYNALRTAVGWNVCDTKAVTQALRDSLHCVCIREDQKLIAFGRVVGDGVMTFYIQDVIVLSDRQGQGHARTVMEDVMGYIKSASTPGAVVGLLSAKGVEGLYEKYGFVSRPVGEQMGAGMILLET